MIFVTKCRKHGELTEDQCYFSQSKTKDNGNRYRCKECYKQYSVNRSLTTKQENLQRIKDWKRENRDKINARVKTDRKDNPDKYRKWQRDYEDRHGELVQERAAARRFKMTHEEYIYLIEVHKNKCAICHEEETRIINGKFCRLCIDHDHNTGKIRGLLCHDCNTALGKMEDSIERLQSAIEYLKKHAETKDEDAITSTTS